MPTAPPQAGVPACFSLIFIDAGVEGHEAVRYGGTIIGTATGGSGTSLEIKFTVRVSPFWGMRRRTWAGEGCSARLRRDDPVRGTTQDRTI